MNQVIAYVRISTDRQEVENQRHEITAYAAREGFSVDVWVEAGVSSRKSTKARRLDETLDMLKRGDVLIVSELSRIGRSIRENLNTLHELGRKGVTCHIVKQGLRTNGKNDVLATMLLANVSFAAELERDLISQRTKSALARKKAEGVVLGNPRLAAEHARQGAEAQAHAEKLRSVLEDMKARQLSQRAMVEELNAKSVPTVRGGRWQLLSLQRVLRRLARGDEHTVTWRGHRDMKRP